MIELDRLAGDPLDILQRNENRTRRSSDDWGDLAYALAKLLNRKNVWKASKHIAAIKTYS